MNPPGLNPWLWAALGIFLCLVPCGIATFRGDLGDRLAALEITSTLVTIELLLLAEGISRSSFFDLPLTLALLSFGGGMVFARFLQRWL
ncbi:MAG: monovalent cation/H+ antiporter complex subunit F [Phycisphaerae bacterium]